MKRTILFALLVSVLVAACSPAESDGPAASGDPVKVEETTSIVTVFRSPT